MGGDGQRLLGVLGRGSEDPEWELGQKIGSDAHVPGPGHTEQKRKGHSKLLSPLKAVGVEPMGPKFVVGAEMGLTGMGGNVAFLGVWRGYSHGPVSSSEGSLTRSVTRPPPCGMPDPGGNISSLGSLLHHVFPE